MKYFEKTWLVTLTACAQDDSWGPVLHFGASLSPIASGRSLTAGQQFPVSACLTCRWKLYQRRSHPDRAQNHYRDHHQKTEHPVQALSWTNAPEEAMTTMLENYWMLDHDLIASVDCCQQQLTAEGVVPLQSAVDAALSVLGDQALHRHEPTYIWDNHSGSGKAVEAIIPFWITNILLL